MSSEPFRVEEVTAEAKPPRARVADAVESPSETPAEVFARKRDYLDGFLAQKPEGEKPHEPGGALYEAVVDALKDIFDPEIPVNIYDLGLIYGVEVTDGGHAIVTMTLTTPHCPVAESMPTEVEMRVCAVPGIAMADVNLVWDPGKMTDEARLELGML